MAEWLNSALFSNAGMPVVAPGHGLCFYIGPFLALKEAGPMRITGEVVYSSRGLKKDYREPFDIDLAAYSHARLPEYGIPEIGKYLKETSGGVKKIGSEVQIVGRQLAELSAKLSGGD
jgi:hypothetical protein